MQNHLAVRVARRLSLEEVDARLRELERKYESTFEKFQERVSKEAERGLMKDYGEWSYMVYALRAYEEGEEFDCVMDEERMMTTDLLSGLTPKRIELLYEIPRFPVESINDLAKRLGRDVKNVYNDLKTLEELGLIYLRKLGRNIVPQLSVMEFSFVFE